MERKAAAGRLHERRGALDPDESAASEELSIVGIFSGAWVNRCPDEVTRAAEAVMQWAGEGKLRPHVDRVLPLERAAGAMSAITDRSVISRTALSVR